MLRVQTEESERYGPPRQLVQTVLKPVLMPGAGEAPRTGRGTGGQHAACSCWRLAGVLSVGHVRQPSLRMRPVGWIQLVQLRPQMLCSIHRPGTTGCSELGTNPTRCS